MGERAETQEFLTEITFASSILSCHIIHFKTFTNDQGGDAQPGRLGLLSRLCPLTADSSKTFTSANLHLFRWRRRSTGRRLQKLVLRDLIACGQLAAVASSTRPAAVRGRNRRAVD